jgi:hypothetical protein
MSPSTHYIGDWVGPRLGLDAAENRKISSPCRESNPHYLAATLHYICVCIYVCMYVCIHLCEIWGSHICEYKKRSVFWDVTPRIVTHPEDGDSRFLKTSATSYQQNKQIWRLLLLGYLGGSLMTLIVIHVNVDNVSDVSEVHSASIFRTQMGRLSESTETTRTSETSALLISTMYKAQE